MTCTRPGGLDPALDLQTLRVVHHKLFGSWPSLTRLENIPTGVSLSARWIAMSPGSATYYEGYGENEREALTHLIYERIQGSFGYEYRENLRP